MQRLLSELAHIEFRSSVRQAAKTCMLAIEARIGGSETEEETKNWRKMPPCFVEFPLGTRILAGAPLAVRERICWLCGSRPLSKRVPDANN